MSEKVNPEKSKTDKPSSGQGGTDKIDLLLMLLIAFFMGSALLVQYQKPLVIAALDKIFGKPKPATVTTLPTMPPIPTMPPQPAPSPEVTPKPRRLPRDFNGIQFLSGYTYVRSLIMQGYKPLAKSTSKPGDYFRILFEGVGPGPDRKNIILEYMGSRYSKHPRFISFIFYKNNFVEVIEKYFWVNPKNQLEKIRAKYGNYDSQDTWKKYDRYIWDNGGMRIVFLADPGGGAAIFNFHIKNLR